PCMKVAWLVLCTAKPGPSPQLCIKGVRPRLCTGHAEARRRGGVERAGDVVVELRLPQLPELGQAADRVVVPVDAQVGHGPVDAVVDQEAGRAHRALLAARLEAGAE